MRNTVTSRKAGKKLIFLALLLSILGAYLWMGIINKMKELSPLEVNEATAVETLRTIQAAEAMFRCTAMAGTGRSDFWTYDVSGMYRIMKGKVPCEVLTWAIAKSDAAWHKDYTFGEGRTQDWNPISHTLGANSGYYVRAMLTDEEGNPYNKNVYSGTAVACANDYDFAFVAYPAEYGKSGIRTFIINQEGYIYYADCGSDADKIVLQWPGKDPAKVKSQGGEYWNVQPWTWTETPEEK